MTRITCFLVGMVAAGTAAAGFAPTPAAAETQAMNEPQKPLPWINDLWDYNDPAASEARFRDLLERARAAGEDAYAAEVLTQIARAQGLAQRFDEARATLEEAESRLTPDMTTARVRVLLERGRVQNSSGDPEGSATLFEQALEAAAGAGLEFYAVDAAHMLGIVVPGEGSLDWNRKAMEMAEAATDPRARGWMGSLSNNLGWTYHDLGRYADALAMFEKHLAIRTAEGDTVQMGIARWSMAKELRMLGRVEEALDVQRALLEMPQRRNNESEGYTQEEIGECLLALERGEEARPHFARAWELLHEDPWLRRDESERLDRLRRLGGMD